MRLRPEFVTIENAVKVFALGGTNLFNLIKEGRIKTVLLRRPGNSSGRRLIFVPSLREFLMKNLQ